MAEPVISLAVTPEEELTGARDELKFLLPNHCLNEFVETLDRQISTHRFLGEGANPQPYAQHFVTTVYMDAPSRSQYRAAQSDIDRNVKVRAREYYDVHPSLAELATEPEQMMHHQPWIWLEMKRREGNRTYKRRARLPKRDMLKLFPGVSAGESVLDWAAGNNEYSAALRDIAAYCRTLGTPLGPACLANYQRLSWQEPGSLLRVTLDLDLAFFAPNADLWQRESVLNRENLGEERGRSSEGVLELKYRGKIPEWLESLLHKANLKVTRHSKFTLASKAVYGE